MAAKQEIRYEIEEKTVNRTLVEESVVKENQVQEHVIEAMEVVESQATEVTAYFERFTAQTAIGMLMSLTEENCLSTPPQNPSHGDWYIFTYTNQPSNKRGWQKDGVQWNNHGLRKDTYNGKVLHKRYFREQKENVSGHTLSRIVYECPEEKQAKQRFLIQYIDDALIPKEQTAALTALSTNKKKTTKKTKDPPSTIETKLLTQLTAPSAFKILSGNTNTVTTVPEEVPESGSWYIYNYSQDLSKSEGWMSDGMEWHLDDTEHVPVCGGWMLKRHHVRVIGELLVGFHRYSYECLPPEEGEGENVEEADLQIDVNEDEEGIISPKKGKGSRKQPKKAKENTQALATGKRRASWKWSPAKGGGKSKKRKESTEETEGGKSKRESAPLPLYRVLVHYLGDYYEAEEIMETVPVPICRAVPLHCFDGTLKTAEVGSNKGIHRRLTVREADRMLRTLPSENCNNYSVQDGLPRAGQWYMIEYSSLCDQSNEWSQDGFMWQVMSKSVHPSFQGQLLHKSYRRIMHNELTHFYRSVYTIMKNGCYSRVLVHYVGLDDELDKEPLSEEDRNSDLCIDFSCFSGFDQWDSSDSTDDSITVLNRDGLSIMVETRQPGPFELDMAAHLLENTLEEDCLTFAPSQPQQGQWYIFSYLALHQFQYHAWRRDGIKWRHNGTFKKAVTENKFLSIKNYRKVVGTRGYNFTRLTYELTDEANELLAKRVLVHYFEGETLSGSSSGSYSSNLTARKPSSTVSVRVSDTEEGKSYTIRCHKFIPDVDLGFGDKRSTAGATGVDDSSIRKAVASILNQEDLADMDSDYLDSGSITKLSKIDSSKALLASGYDSANNFYYEEVVTTSGDGILPSQIVQEISQRYITDEEDDTSVDSGMPYAYRIDRDIVTSLHEFLFKIKDTHHIFFQLIPTTISILVCKYGINEFKAIMNDPSARHIVYYDKTWRIGGLHVSSLYTRHDHCERENLFPIAIIIHELDDLPTHEVIMEKMLGYCDNLNSPDLMIVTDASPCVVNACKLVIPQTKRASSWVNIVEAIRAWFAKHKFFDDNGQILANVKQLLATATLGEYNAIYDEVSLAWLPEFKLFYEEYLTEVVFDSNTGNLLAASMYFEEGIATEGSREFLMQMEYLFANSEVAYIDALAHLAYYMLYYYKNESEKGKVSTNGILFRRKPNVPGKFVKKKNGFFPSWCAVPNDVASAILNKMRVGQPVIKPETDFTGFDETDEYKELCSIEVDLDEEMMGTVVEPKEEISEYIEMFTEEDIEEKCIELDELTLNQNEQALICLQNDGFDQSVIDHTTFKGSKSKSKAGLRIASKSTLFGANKSETPTKKRKRKTKRKSKGTVIVEHETEIVSPMLNNIEVSGDRCDISVMTITNDDECYSAVVNEEAIKEEGVDWYEGETVDAVTEIEFI